jgi:glutamate formiminotransferase
MSRRLSEIVESVTNVSEGRDARVISTIGSTLVDAGALLLDVASDPDHNRTVFSYIGDLRGIEEAAFQAIRVASSLIDLRRHRGVHPRIGAIDVVPFIPIKGVDMAACVALARRLGERVARNLALPVYLYEEAALREETRQLPDIRRGGFEGLLTAIETDPARRPDFGGPRLHPTAGAVIIGARRLLVAFNVFLDTDDVESARLIARSLREKDGGLPWVRALGFLLPTRHRAQVSVNLRDYRVTPLIRVWERILEEASRLGVSVASSEIIGLVPQDALPENPAETLRLDRFDRGQILEVRISEALAQAEAAQP